MSDPALPVQPRLDGLPVEVIEAFASLLDLTDMCNLRLTSDELAAKASQGRFKTHFRHKTIDSDDRQQLATFQHLTQPNELGCLVEKLTIRRNAPSSGNEVAEVSTDAVLQDSFRNLRFNGRHYCLKEFVLDVLVKDTVVNWSRFPSRNGWITDWASAGTIYRFVMAALHSSELRISRLSIFGDNENCSLAFDQLASYPEVALPSTSLGTLGTSSVSSSHSMFVRSAGDKDVIAPAPLQINSIDYIEALFKLCTGLRNLDVHWFMIWQHG